MFVNIDDLVQTLMALSIFSGGFYHLVLKPIEKASTESKKEFIEAVKDLKGCVDKVKELLKGIELSHVDIKAQIRILENSVKSAHRRMDESKIPRAEGE